MAGVVLAIALALTSGCGGRKASGPPLPPVAGEVAQATREYLASDGAPLLAFDEVAGGIVRPGRVDPVTCERGAAALAERVGTARPTELATGVPDWFLAQLFLSEQSALVNGLAACGRGDAGDAQAQFAIASESRDLVQRRLKDLGW